MNKRTIYQRLTFLILLLFQISGCSFIFYQPTSYLYVAPESLGLEYQEVKFKASDKTPLNGWLFPSSKKPESFTLFFHGNAQNLTAHYLNLKWMPAKNHSFFIFDYRGYGVSGYTDVLYGHGERAISPNQQGVHKDAIAALELAHKLFKKSHAKRFIVYGQSLGGAILMRALEDFKHTEDIDLIILDSTFLSYQSLAFDKLWSVWPLKPLSPLSYLLVSDEYASKSFLQTNKTKTLIIHGTNDRVIPFKFGQEIYSKLKHTDKIFWKVTNGRHIDVFNDGNKKYRKKLDQFIKSL